MLEDDGCLASSIDQKTDICEAMFKKAGITYWIKAKVKDVRLVLYLLVLQLLGMVVQGVVDLKVCKRYLILFNLTAA